MSSISPGNPGNILSPGINSQVGAPAAVSVGSIDFSETSTKYQPSPSGPYTDYVINNKYYKDGEIVMCPIASPDGFQGASVAFGQLAAATLLWICDWTASKTGEQPIAPDPNPTNSDWILMYEIPEPAVVSLMADGVTPIYRISGTYVYGNKNPSKKTIDDINYPRRPDVQDTIPRSISSSALQQGLSNLSTGGSNQAPSPGNPGVSTQSQAPAGISFQ